MGYKRIDTEKDRKLKFLGYCSKCKKDTPQRFNSGSLYESRYKCIKCKTINIEEINYQ